MIVRPWVIGDSAKVALQPSQQYTASVVDLSQDLTPLAELGLVWSGEHDGEVLACGGLLPHWPGRATAWMLIGESSGPHFSVIHKAVMRGLVTHNYRRVEAHVDVGFAEGVRWMKMLGFEFEGYKRAYRPDGADMLGFVRIRL